MITLAHPAREVIATSQRQNRSSTVSMKDFVACRADPKKSTRGTSPGARNDYRKLTPRKNEGALARASKVRRMRPRIESVASVRDRRLTATQRRTNCRFVSYPRRARCPGGVLCGPEPRGGDCHQEHRPPCFASPNESGHPFRHQPKPVGESKSRVELTSTSTVKSAPPRHQNPCQRCEFWRPPRVGAESPRTGLMTMHRRLHGWSRSSP